ncbi:MAG: ABC transporter permease subunit [Spirochaetota bacterium]
MKFPLWFPWPEKSPTKKVGSKILLKFRALRKIAGSGIGFRLNTVLRILGVSTLGFLCLAPFVLLVSGAWQADYSVLRTLFSSVMPRYLGNTLLLCAGVLFSSLAIGVTTAWFTSRYDFPLRKFFTLLLPLSIIISPYMRSLVFMEYANSLQFTLYPLLERHLGKAALFLNQWWNFPYLVMALTFSLFPYVYVFASSLYRKNSGAIIDNARLLNRNHRSLFFAVGLPIAGPALRIGAAVVLMDTLNEYGAISYFGFPTISSAVFRTWFVYKDIGSAKFLATLVLLAVIFLVAISQKKDHKTRYDAQQYYPAGREQLPFLKGLGIGIFCMAQVFGGLLLPIYHFIRWTTKAGSPSQLASLSLDTLAFLTVSLSIGILIAVPLSYFCHISYREESRSANGRCLGIFSISKKLYRFVFHSMTMGYAIPSTIVGIAVLGFIYFLVPFYSELPALLAGKTIAGLVFAAVLRFFFVIAKPMYQGFHHYGRRYEDAAYSLGAKNTFRRVALPLNAPFVFSGSLLLLIEILKEIPLTLILRPFNFNTLAIKAYMLARDEMLFASALPTLLIIGMGFICILLFQWIEQKWKPV